MGGEHGESAAAHAELRVDRSDVALDGVHRHGEVDGDLLERQHGGQQPEHGDLPLAQHRRLALLTGTDGEHPVRELRPMRRSCRAGAPAARGRAARPGRTGAARRGVRRGPGRSAGRGGRRAVRPRRPRSRSPAASPPPRCAGAARAWSRPAPGGSGCAHARGDPPRRRPSARITTSSARVADALGQPAQDGARRRGVPEQQRGAELQHRHRGAVLRAGLVVAEVRAGLLQLGQPVRPVSQVEHGGPVDGLQREPRPVG